MIRVDRGPEPTDLPSIRAREIARVAPTYSTGTFDRELLGREFAQFREQLWREHHCKCCYCEKVCEVAGNDVEHYRPASIYWWLSWTWANLLFACPNCNRWAKNAAFPLALGSKMLQPCQSPPGGEVALLIDPADPALNPIDHIQFVLEEGRWWPRPRGGSVRGAETIRVLELDRPSLLEHYKNHVETQLRPELEEVKAAMAAGDERRVHILWRSLTRRALQPTATLVALSFDAIDHFIPESDRLRWYLGLQRP